MLKTIASGKADAILCWKLDRLARNMVDGGQIMDLLQKSVIKEIRTYESVHVSSDNVLMLAVHFGMANQYIRDLSVNVKRGNRAKLERGEWPNHAPFGYLNDKATKKIVVDKKLVSFVQDTFRLYASGDYTLTELSNEMYVRGFRTYANRKVAKSMIYKIITNPFYSGIMARDGKFYRGNHKPMISKELFDQVSDVLNGKNRKRPKFLFFPFRGFMTCDQCGCMLTTTLAKGHMYYYCTNWKGGCSQHKRYLTSKDAGKMISQIFSCFDFDEELFEIACEAAKQKGAHNDDSWEQSRQVFINDLETIKERQEKLLDTYLAGNVPKVVYEAKMAGLANERVSVETKLTEIKVRKGEGEITFEQVKEIFLSAKTAQKRFLEADDNQKAEVVKKLLSNISVKDNLAASYLFKMPYERLRNVAKITTSEGMLPDLDSNQDEWIQSPLSYH
jgi:site-specific DNA recombinase